MSKLHSVFGDNLTECRHSFGMTQKELADKLNYSDKAVSKWERGESVPDISVLKELASIFGVSVDYLLTQKHEISDEEIRRNKIKRRNYWIITLMSIMLVWLVASVLFVLFRYLFKGNPWHFLIFIYASVVACIVWLILNSVWLNKKLNFVIISLLMWCSLLALFMTFLPMGLKLWFIFSLGIPGQIIIILWSRIKKS